jgi:hypothetical protein
MKITTQKIIFGALVTVFLICISLNGKAIAQENTFASVPEHLRVRLVERLQLLVDYQRNRQWSNHYDLLVSDITDKINKENYVKEQERLNAKKLSDVLIGFKPQTAAYVIGAPYDVLIKGCAEFQERNRIVKLQATVEAYQEKGDWYFTRVSADVPIDGNAPPCSSNTEQAAKPSSDCFSKP